MSQTSAISVRQRKQQGITLLQAGRLDEAIHQFEELSRDARRDPDVWHLLSACHGMQGNYIQCEVFARKAIALMPSFSGAWNNLGTALHSQGKLAEAEAAFRKAIQHAPAEAQSHSNLGNVYREMKKTKEAENCYREALRHQPNFPDALTNLGLAMQDRDEMTEAVALHRRALALNPQHADACYNLGHVLMQLGEGESALNFLERVTQLSPNEARGWTSLGGVCARVHDHKRAVLCYERGISLDPNNAENLSALGICYLVIGEREKSVAALNRALVLNPDNSEIRYWLAAAGIGEAPETMSPDAVAKLFDGYAGNFDKHLVETLRYRIPSQMSAALRRARKDDARALDLLDIGCGTGLLGIEVRDITGYLAGVDLSPKMIDQARKRGIYHDLAVQDITDYMEDTSRHYDAVLSADVFVYLGNLDRVFAATAARLHLGGWFAFSVEGHFGNESYNLRTSGRYAHSLPYLRELSARHNFTEISVETVTVRMEKGISIDGYLMVLQRQ